MVCIRKFHRTLRRWTRMNEDEVILGDKVFSEVPERIEELMTYVLGSETNLNTLATGVS